MVAQSIPNIYKNGNLFLELPHRPFNINIYAILILKFVMAMSIIILYIFISLDILYVYHLNNKQVISPVSKSHKYSKHLQRS